MSKLKTKPNPFIGKIGTCIFPEIVGEIPKALLTSRLALSVAAKVAFKFIKPACKVIFSIFWVYHNSDK